MDWKFQTFLLLIFFTVGIIGHSLEETFPLMIVLTPYVLLISGIWAIHRCYNKKYVLFWILIAYIITFFLEAVGVSEGLIFGPYYYGDVLGPKIFNVPIIIGLNWVIIIFSLLLFSEWLINSSFKSQLNNKVRFFFTSVLTATFAMLFDFLMEPAAIGLTYWTWTLTSDPMNIPTQNFIAWFLISFSFALTYLIIPKKERMNLEGSPHSPWFVLIQVVFFIAIRIILFS